MIGLRVPAWACLGHPDLPPSSHLAGYQANQRAVRGPLVVRGSLPLPQSLHAIVRDLSRKKPPPCPTVAIDPSTPPSCTRHLPISLTSMAVCYYPTGLDVSTPASHPKPIPASFCPLSHGQRFAPHPSRPCLPSRAPGRHSALPLWCPHVDPPHVSRKTHSLYVCSTLAAPWTGDSSRPRLAQDAADHESTVGVKTSLAMGLP